MMTRKRRLLQVLQPVDAGVPQHVADLVRGLDPRRYEITVACPRGSQAWRALEADPAIRLLSISARRPPSPLDIVTLARLLPHIRRADLVHAHSSKAGFVVRLGCLLTGRRDACLFTPHGWSFWAARGVRRKLFERLERSAARWCARIIAVSRQERDAGLEVAIGDRDLYVVIHNGVDILRFTPARAPDKRVVMVGRLAAPKRQDLLISALPYVAEAIPGVRLQLAGDGPGGDELRRIAGRVAVEVEFLGSRLDVAEILSGAGCLVLASEYEGCPLSVLEAMASGVPVVASAVGGIPELIEHGRSGLLVREPDERSFASAIVAVLSDGSLAESLASAALTDVRERFSLDHMLAATENCYDEICAVRATSGPLNG